MVAPVAFGTLAGSTSGSWASNHKEAAGSDCSRLRRHPRVVGLAHLCRPSRSRTSSPGPTPQPSEKQQSEIGVAGGARFVRRGGATPRIRGCLSAAAGCAEHTVRWSPAVTARGIGATIGTVAKHNSGESSADARNVAEAEAGVLGARETNALVGHTAVAREYRDAGGRVVVVERHLFATLFPLAPAPPCPSQRGRFRGCNPSCAG